MTKRNPPPPDRPQAQTLPAQGDDQQPVPRLPHERDESADSQVNQAPAARAKGRLAHADAQRGIPDTTQGKELDDTYDRLREGAPNVDKQQRSP